LDEATSSLDPVSEKVVQKALDGLLDGHSGAAICVAHRLTTIMNCDSIVFMHEGRKVEQGTHTELLKLPTTKDKVRIRFKFRKFKFLWFRWILTI